MHDAIRTAWALVQYCQGWREALSRPPGDPLPSCLQCITAWHRDNGFASSLELPDNTLNFAKKHPLMDEPVLPHGGHPLLLKKGANLTHLAVDRAHGLDGQLYNVLFLGTGIPCPGHPHLSLDGSGQDLGGFL